MNENSYSPVPGILGETPLVPPCPVKTIKVKQRKGQGSNKPRKGATRQPRISLSNK